MRRIFNAFTPQMKTVKALAIVFICFKFGPIPLPSSPLYDQSRLPPSAQKTNDFFERSGKQKIRLFS
jgi:hypothetical protein